MIVRRIGNQDWIDESGMNGKQYAQDRWNAPFNIDWDRVVVDVQGNTITIDAPITCAIEKKWGGGEVIEVRGPRAHREGRRGEPARHVGVQPDGPHEGYGNMDRPNYAPEEYYSDESHHWNFITFNNIKNGWVRN